MEKNRISGLFVLHLRSMILKRFWKKKMLFFEFLYSSLFYPFGRTKGWVIFPHTAHLEYIFKWWHFPFRRHVLLSLCVWFIVKTWCKWSIQGKIQTGAVGCLHFVLFSCEKILAFIGFCIFNLWNEYMKCVYDINLKPCSPSFSIPLPFSLPVSLNLSTFPLLCSSMREETRIWNSG